MDQSKFVRDVMQGYLWGMHRKPRTVSNKDFTEDLSKLELIGRGNDLKMILGRLVILNYGTSEYYLMER